MDLNSDLAEGFGRWTLGDDAALLDIVTSANVACGFHAGDPGVIRKACEQAAENGVAIGAQVGYRDLAGFGRRFIDMEPTELTDEVIYQIGAVSGLARVVGTEVTYVKPHGALYNAIAEHEQQARAVIDAVRQYDPSLVLLGLAGSKWLEWAEQAGLRTVHEAFADRAYTPEGKLVSRRQAGAVLHDPQEIARRCLRIARGEPIEAIDGSQLLVRAGSICVHGDSPGAVNIANEVRAVLIEGGVRLKAFAPNEISHGAAAVPAVK